MQVLYMGFEQEENIRQYIFHRITHGEETTVFFVSTDLALLRRNHVNLQEGPALCLHALMAELVGTEWPQQMSLRRLLTRGALRASTIRKLIVPFGRF